MITVCVRLDSPCIFKAAACDNLKERRRRFPTASRQWVSALGDFMKAMKAQEAGKEIDNGKIKGGMGEKGSGAANGRRHIVIKRDIVIFAAGSAHMKEAELLGKRLNADVTGEEPGEGYDGLMMRLDDNGLALTGGGLTLRGDFIRMLPRLKTSNLQRELLVKAAKLKDAEGVSTAIDATAGLGEDSLLLAAAGFSVQLYEYNPVIAALLEDAMRRAAEVPELAEIVGRMRLSEEDSLTALPKLPDPPDVILLDPMFPERQKSALVKKKFQLLQRLEMPCNDEDELMCAAMEAHPRKVIIKRPLKGPYLTGRKPSYSLKGKSIRYDCVVLS